MSRPTNREVAEVLDEAAAIIERGGWCRGSYRRGTKRCASGAIGQASHVPSLDATGPFRVSRRAEDELKKHVGATSIPFWNDNVARNSGDVLRALRLTATGLRKRARKAAG